VGGCLGCWWAVSLVSGGECWVGAGIGGRLEVFDGEDRGGGDTTLRVFMKGARLGPREETSPHRSTGPPLKEKGPTRENSTAHLRKTHLC
jgi:hypothetical protein